MTARAERDIMMSWSARGAARLDALRDPRYERCLSTVLLSNAFNLVQETRATGQAAPAEVDLNATGSHDCFMTHPKRLAN